MITWQPEAIDWAAIMIAFIPDAHTLLIVVHGVVVGSPVEKNWVGNSNSEKDRFIKDLNKKKPDWLICPFIILLEHFVLTWLIHISMQHPLRVRFPNITRCKLHKYQGGKLHLPAPRAACLAGACPAIAERTLPM